MKSAATSVADYLTSLPADRRAALSALREVIRANLDADYEEGMQYGMIGYYVPHRVFPAGYHTDPTQPLPFAALASQKNHMSLYLMGVYCGCAEGVAGETSDAKWFRETWARTGKKLDMGKACLRFASIDSLALDVVGEAIRRIPAKVYVERYSETLLSRGKKAPAAAKRREKGTKKATKKAVAKKTR